MSVATIETGLAVAVSWVGNPVSMFLAIHRKPFGWWIVAVTQAAFCAFAIIGRHWEFGGQALCLLMGCYGVYRWQLKRTHEPAIGAAVRPEPPRAGGFPKPTDTGSFPVYPRLPNPTLPPAPPIGRMIQQAVKNVPLPRMPALQIETKTEAIQPKRNGHKVLAEPQGAAWDRLVVAQDAIAALNHFDRKAAQELQDRLELTR
jgi:hypothetical protein